jgi:glycosyltransferase involved in cell wall biosynthesis
LEVVTDADPAKGKSFLTGDMAVRVVHLIQRYPPALGGSETWCREVSRYLSSVGDEVKVLTMDILDEEEYWRDPPLRQWATRLGRIDWDDGVLVRRYRRSLPIHLVYHLLFKVILDRTLRLYFYGPHSAEMYGSLWREFAAADVIHLHTVPYPHNLFGYVAARLRKKRVVITPHFHPGHPNYERRSNYWLLKGCDAVICVSPYEREYLISQGLDPKKLVVTGNGVHAEAYVAKDLPRFQAELIRRHELSVATKVVVFVGRKQEYKGVATLVDAVRILSLEDDVVLFMAGPSSDWFEEYYATLSEKDRQRIIDLGTVSEQEKVNLLHVADVLALPSRFEAFGIVFLEAWACGTPVIGAAAGAIPSVVGEGGLTFEPGNVQDLADKLRIVLNDAERSREMALLGQRRVFEQFTWGKIAQATRTAYSPAGAEICAS